MFRLMILLTFCLSALNHFLLPRGIISRTLIITMLCGFVYTEGYLAITVDPTMSLYVVLNIWGLYNFWQTRVAGGAYWDFEIQVTEEDLFLGR